MGKITDVTPQKGNKNRVSVFIDGRFYCGFDALTALKCGLKTGADIDEETLTKISAESEYRTALDKSLSFLAIRVRSRKEISDYLKGKGYCKEVVSKVKERLVELGQLDDKKFAELYIADNKSRYGSVRLKVELLKKGVNPDTIDEAIDGSDRSEEILALAKKLLASSDGNKYKLKEKLYRKGFDGDEISDALSFLEEEGAFSEEE